MQKTKLLSFNTYLCVYSVYRYISHMDHFRRSLVKSGLKSKVNENKCLFVVFLYMYMYLSHGTQNQYQHFYA